MNETCPTCGRCSNCGQRVPLTTEWTFGNNAAAAPSPVVITIPNNAAGPSSPIMGCEHFEIRG